MKVKLIAHNSDIQLTHGGHGYVDTREYLEEGKEYDAVIEKHDWHTNVYINGRAFNSVCFAPLEAEAMSKWFGKGCEHQCCQWEENEETGGPNYKEAHPSLIFCNNKANTMESEGNCTEALCPLGGERK